MGTDPLQRQHTAVRHDDQAAAPPYTLTARSFFNPTAEERRANRHLLFSFNGRVGRSTYWLFAVVPLSVFGSLTAEFDLSARMGTFGFLVTSLLLGWIALAVSVKRCHDRNRSANFLLVQLIPILGPVWVLIELGLLAGSPGDNRFGPDPLQSEHYGATLEKPVAPSLPWSNPPR